MIIGKKLLAYRASYWQSMKGAGPVGKQAAFAAVLRDAVLYKNEVEG